MGGKDSYEDKGKILFELGKIRRSELKGKILCSSKSCKEDLFKFKILLLEFTTGLHFTFYTLYKTGLISSL